MRSPQIWFCMVLIFIGFGLCTKAMSEEAVDVALVLAVDVSDSVTAEEKTLQREGYAEALASQEVLDVIRANDKGRIAVAYYEWSSVGDHRLAINWTVIDGPAAAERVAAILRTLQRTPPPAQTPNPWGYGYGNTVAGLTALGDALEFGGTLMASAPTARRRVIDVSGDGVNNQGPEPGEIRDGLISAGITVNGLPILSQEPYLADYYASHVVGGELSFVLPAKDFADVARAVRIKLMNEIASVAPRTRFADLR